jgi:hypothetical protein
LLPVLRGNEVVQFRSDLGYNPDTERFTLLYSDPAIGWKIAFACARYGLKLHTVLDAGDDAIFRAYLYCCNPKRYNDEVMARVLAMHDSRMDTASRAIRSMLFAPNIDADMIAGNLDMSADVVRTYEQLFYNVLDRKKDATYLTKLIYPHGRLVEYMERYIHDARFEDIVARTGFNNGVADVMHFLGASNNMVDSMIAADAGKNLEKLMMAQGYVMARNGFLNQTNHAASIGHARQLISAGKLGGQDTGAGDSDFLYMADSWWAELERQKRLEHAEYVEHRLGISLEAEEVLPQATP